MDLDICLSVHVEELFVPGIRLNIWVKIIGKITDMTHSGMPYFLA